MTVCVTGLGRVGLPSALPLVQRHDAVSVGVDEASVGALNRGEVPPDASGRRALAERVVDRPAGEATEFDVTVLGDCRGG